MNIDIAYKPLGTEAASLEAAILQTIQYADVFDYPLTDLQIHRYLTARQATTNAVLGAMCQLMDAGLVVRTGEFFSLPGRESIIAIRHSRAEAAAALWRKAFRYGRILASLPFVRMVAITGSLSMDNSDWGTDIDLMLVSTPQRLWTCRALVLLVGRLAQLEGVTLCPNYMVTTHALEFKERSLYVAHEVAQMVPLSGLDVYGHIRALNSWTDEYLPNAQGAPRSFTTRERPSRWKTLLEAALAMFPVSWFEAWEMHRKVGRLSREQAGSPEAHFSSDVCKGHADKHKEHAEALLWERFKVSTRL